MKTKHTIAAAGLAAVLASAGLAGASLASSHDPESSGGTMEGIDHGAMDGGSADASPATQAFEAANMEMMSGMDMEYTGDTNVDFAQGMIPHHQGAIAMAEIMLEHGEDPVLRELAQTIIADQEREIAVLEEWLAENAN